MKSQLFDQLCSTLGYEPDTVLAIRVTARQTVVTHTDAAGNLCITTTATSGRTESAAVTARAHDGRGVDSRP